MRPTPTQAKAGHLLLDVPTAVSHSCGDLLFSSHTIFFLTFVLFYQRHGSARAAKHAAWLACLAFSWLIIASRKHYTVDVLVAWYTVPLVFHYCQHALWAGDGGGARRPLFCALGRCCSAPGCCALLLEEGEQLELRDVLVQPQQLLQRDQHDEKQQAHCWQQWGAAAAAARSPPQWQVGAWPHDS
jgi:hypothetical protein